MQVSAMSWNIRKLMLLWHFSRDAGWSSPVARWAHNPKVAGSNPAPATILATVRWPFHLGYDHYPSPKNSFNSPNHWSG